MTLFTVNSINIKFNWGKGIKGTEIIVHVFLILGEKYLKIIQDDLYLINAD